jgi:hypothetical protein
MPPLMHFEIEAAGFYSHRGFSPVTEGNFLSFLEPFQRFVI